MVRIARRDDVYAATARFIAGPLLTGVSLFGHVDDVWALPVVDNLYHRLTSDALDPSDNAVTLLRARLNSTLTETIQLAGELLFLHLLFESDSSQEYKLDLIQSVLDLSPRTTTAPISLRTALAGGIAPFGSAARNRAEAVSYLMSVVYAWKTAPAALQSTAAHDPWTFKELVATVPVRGHAAATQREALLHLFFPDTFERIVIPEHKAYIVNHYLKPADSRHSDIDRELLAIRTKLAPLHGDAFDFYQPDLLDQWGSRDNRWDFYFWETRRAPLEPRQVAQLKRSITNLKKRLREAKVRILNDDDSGLAIVLDAMRQYSAVIHPPVIAFLEHLTSTDHFLAQSALRHIWGTESLQERITAFIHVFSTGTHVPPDLLASLLSILLVIDESVDLVPYDPDTTSHAMMLSQSGDVDRYTSATHQLASYVDFLDSIIAQQHLHGTPIRNRVDAWLTILSISKPMPENSRTASVTHSGQDIIASGDVIRVPTDVDVLSDHLLFPIDHVRLYLTLLRMRRYIIFYGPSGTGKSHVARELASHLSQTRAAGHQKGSVTVLKLHSTHTTYQKSGDRYESNDYQGITPESLEGLLLSARENPTTNHILVFDDIHRFMSHDILGDLLTFLDARDAGRNQDASNGSVVLPSNVFILGTMASDQRFPGGFESSLLRKFFFVPFRPDEEPVQGLLRRWLARHNPEMLWVAELLDAANREIGDADRMIGPSHFMVDGLDAASVEMIWRHAVLPYIELVVRPRNIEIFALERLMKKVSASVAPPVVTLDQRNASLGAVN